MVEAADLFQVVFSRKQTILAPTVIGASMSDYGFIGVFFISKTIYTPITKEFPYSHSMVAGGFGVMS